MNRVLIISAVLTVLTVTASCIRSIQIEEAGAVADSFIAAYCSGDWSAAASFCTEPLKSHIAGAPVITADADTSVTSAATAILKNISWTKQAVETEEKTDDVTFNCTALYNDRTVSYTVTLTPTEKSWAIVKIQ